MPAAMAGADDETLRAVGLSRQKMRYARALAQAGLDFDALRRAPNDEVIATLVALPGIGRWTAEIYAMFSLGRADVFAPGDLALQEAARMSVRAGGAAVGKGAARDGRSLVALARRCGAAAVGLLPGGQGTGGYAVTRELEFGRRRAAVGQGEKPRGLPAWLWGGWGGPAGAGRCRWGRICRIRSLWRPMRPSPARAIPSDFSGFRCHGLTARPRRRRRRGLVGVGR